MESGVGALTSQFGAIVGQLDETLRGLGALGGAGDDSSFFSALNDGRRASSRWYAS